MISLIISNDKNVSEQFNTLFKNHGFETIKYKWFLKALDNLEEIEPDFIVVNADEYPRHWKMISMFLKCSLVEKPIKLVLYTAEQITKDEQKKIDFLAADYVISDFSQESINELFTENLQMENENDSELISVSVSDFEEIIQVDDVISEISQDETEELFSVSDITESYDDLKGAGVGDFMFNNPADNSLICGKYLDFNGSKITCKISDDVKIDNLNTDDFIKYFTYYNNSECKSITAKLNDVLDFVDGKFLILDVLNYYEE
ncbi:MAG: hypothetical protein MJ188_02545 [Treponema sp.]|nr:hypothetical protein [Treponema sp.]